MATSCMYNYSIERCRSEEFPHLKDAVYVDHAGATLYSRSQLTAVHSDLTSHLYGNPHSHNASSHLATDNIDQIRWRLLRLFKTTPDDYSLIFTSGCTASLKIIADGFRFHSGASSDQDSGDNGVFCFLLDSHTSVQGMREAVAARCSDIHCLDEDELQSAICKGNNSAFKMTGCVQPPHCGPGDCSSSIDGPISFPPSSPMASTSSSSVPGPQSLMAFPAQSNFSGRKYPLRWVQDIQTGGLNLDGRRPNHSDTWFVLLDAAAFVSTSHLDLSQVKPDFVTLSFYKIFGYPTGLGALLVHRRAWATLGKSYYGGGTVAMSTARERFHALRPQLHQRFEDGSVSFLDIISLRHGLDTIHRLAGGMDRMSEHVFAVAQYFHHNLHGMRHHNAQPMAQIYGDLDFLSPEDQGGIVTFNLQRSDGSFVGYSEVDKFSQLHDIHLRTGCFCNIGACQKYLKLSSQIVQDNFSAGHVCGDNMDLIDGRPTGAVRISFGYMSTLGDVRACLRFLADSFLEHSTLEPPTFAYPDWYSTAQPGDGGVPEVPESLNKPLLVSPVAVKETVNDESNMTSAASISVTCSLNVRKVTDILLYPVKSCGSFQVREWEMSTKGLTYDRVWILVSDTGVVISQKREPRICMLKPHINLVRGKLILNFPGSSPFELPLDQEDDFEAMSSFCTNRVCGDRVNTFDCGDSVSDWLSEAIGMSRIRLLRQQSNDTRLCKLKDKLENGDSSSPAPCLSMANESQLLVISRASVRVLQTKMSHILTDTKDANDTKMATAPEDISEDNLLLRFRANLVIDGGKAFEEEDWALVTLGGESLVCQDRCTRCQMICMDQETAVKSREPLRTLNVWRGKQAYFGMHSRILPRSDGSKQIIRVGDAVKP